MHSNPRTTCPRCESNNVVLENYNRIRCDQFLEIMWCNDCCKEYTIVTPQPGSDEISDVWLNNEWIVD